MPRVLSIVATAGLLLEPRWLGVPYLSSAPALAFSAWAVLYIGVLASRTWRVYADFWAPLAQRTIDRLATGEAVRVEGVVRCGPGVALVAPVTRALAVHYEFEEDVVLIESEASKRRNPKASLPVFTLADDTGQIEVATPGALFVARLQQAAVRSRTLYIVGTLIGSRDPRNALEAILVGDKVRVVAQVGSRSGRKILESSGRGVTRMIITNLTDTEFRSRHLFNGLALTLALPLVALIGGMLVWGK
ncbi:MAG: hypothetical protein HY303_18810 [Candidatus Wallbacteria bacterium]|nr:hypothetical protein [Candidatus Wallbacteria bacterium]